MSEIFFLGTTNWKEWRNEGTSDIDAFEVFQVTGSDVVGDESVLLGKMPDGTGTVFAVNGPMKVESTRTGAYFTDTEVLVTYDGDDPDVGDIYGPQDGYSTVKKNWWPGIFECLGVINSNFTIMRARMVPCTTAIGKLDGPLPQGGSATVSVWAGDLGSEEDTGANITAGDWLMKSGATAIARGKKVICKRINGKWYVVEAECA